jgi:hypothetical protein
MSKIVRLTESELTRLIKKIIVEQNLSPDVKSQISQLIKTEDKKIKQYYQEHYSKPETVSKFKNKNNINELKKFITTISYKPFFEKSGKNGFVNKSNPKVINLNVNNLFTKQGDTITTKGSLLYDTILHEMAHLIDFKMQKLGEKTIASSSGYYSTNNGKQDEYVQSDIETFARVQRLREVLGLNPNADGNNIKQKLIELIKSKKLIFPNVRISNITSPTGLLFTPQQRTKGDLLELWRFYSPIKINGTSVPDISALFGKYSSYQNDGSIALNLEMIGKVNASTKAFPNVPNSTDTTPQ